MSWDNTGGGGDSWGGGGGEAGTFDEAPASGFDNAPSNAFENNGGCFNCGEQGLVYLYEHNCPSFIDLDQPHEERVPATKERWRKQWTLLQLWSIWVRTLSKYQTVS